MDDYELWQDGDITDMQALNSLYTALATLEQDIKALEARRSDLRDAISWIVAENGDAVELPGLATLRITAPSQRVSYAAKDVDAAVAQIAAYAPEAAQAVAALRKVSHVAGSLRIEPKREGKK